MDEARTKNSFRRLAVCALWLVVWQAASLMLGSVLLLPGPLDVCRGLVHVLASPAFPQVLWFSFSRIALGFMAAFFAGVGFGLVAHRWHIVHELLEPVVLAIKSIPVACITVLLLMWVGSREVSGACVFLMAFPALYLATVEGLSQLDPKTDAMLSIFGVRGLRRFCAHVWPSLLPFLVATSRNACGMAWKAGVAAELIGTPLGSIGERVYQAKILLETADLFAWTIIVVAISYGCERGFLWVLRHTGSLSYRLAVPRGGGEVSADEQSADAIRVRGGAFGYGGDSVLNDVDLLLAAGERAVLSDASGAGKTTLLHALAGLLPPRAGVVEAPHAISMVFQEARLIEALTAEENVLLVDAGGRSRAEVRELLLELLPADVLDHPASELSGGQRRRVEIVRAMAHPSQAVLMDEPFASLDEETHCEAAAFVLRHLAGRTLLVASHAPDDATLLAARRVSLVG